MKVSFATLIKGTGYGTHVDIDVELVDADIVEHYDAILPGIGLLFEDSIDDVFKRGSIFIKRVIIENYDLIKDKMDTPKVLIIKKTSADRVHYQPIAFLGATIKWLNEYFGTKMEIPKYTYDRETKTFGIE